MFIRKKIISGAGGFTLIELAVTVAIVGIMSSFAITGYLSWKPGYVFRGAVSQVRADLNRAKMRAVETRRQCRVEFSTTGYQIFDGNQVMNTSPAAANWGNIDANGNFTPITPYRTRNFSSYPDAFIQDLVVGPPRVVSDIGATNPTITFSPRGTASNDSLHVAHPNAAGADISVNLTGRINITWL